ncbi:MAG: hypothetical protein C4321_09630 [Chloroflexota bacterium]
MLVTAGLLKARDPAWPATARTFGAPRLVVPVLPWIEVGLGAALAAQLRWAGAVAAAMLVAFTVPVVRHAARHTRVPCACFGALSAGRPVSWATVARNLVLVALAVVATLA